MATYYLIDAARDRIGTALLEAQAEANEGARSRILYGDIFADGWARQIADEAEGILQIDGGGVANSYRYRAETSSLVACWWTTGDGRKLILIAGQRVTARASSRGSAGGVARVTGTPEEAVRGWRRLKKGEIRGTFPVQLSHLNDLPTAERLADPTRDGLELAARYGDEGARMVMSDYLAEKEVGIR
jgi:hypothetical protein